MIPTQNQTVQKYIPVIQMELLHLVYCPAVRMQHVIWMQSPESMAAIVKRDSWEMEKLVNVGKCRTQLKGITKNFTFPTFYRMHCDVLITSCLLVLIT